MIFGQDDMNCGIIYGKNHAFSFTAPEGWVLDIVDGVLTSNERKLIKQITTEKELDFQNHDLALSSYA